MNKRGVTFFALVLTILIALILITTSIAVISNNISNSRISSFAEEMSNIEEAVALYYFENKELPSIPETGVISKVAILEEVPDKTSFEAELNSNGDSNFENFYRLNLNKIGVTRTNYNENSFVIVENSHHVYYLEGIKSKGNIYFSISQAMTGAHAVRKEYIGQEEKDSEITISGNVKVTKKTKRWTNELGIQIDTYMESGESLLVQFNGKKKNIETSEGNFSKTFNTLQEINKDFSSEDENALINLSNEKKYIIVEKQDKDGNILASVKVDLSNIDIARPTQVTKTPKVETKDEMTNNITFYVADVGSGVKEVRYEYFTTYDRDDSKEGKVAYYSGSKITREYLKNAGRQVIPDSDGKISIDLPKGVSSIKLVIVDNAGNMSDAIELETEVENEIYYSLTSLKKNEIIISFYGTGVISGNVSYSPNGKSYANNSLIFKAGSAVTISNMSGIDEKVYLKVTSGANTRVIELNLSEILKGTNIKENSKYYNPYIPSGFSYIEGNAKNGLVIQDVSNGASKYNEFVWIPVDGKNVKFERKIFNVNGTISTLNNKDKFSETSVYEDEFKKSVEKYGGFYVARFEAGVDASNSEIILSQRGKDPMTNISFQKAIEMSNNMYTSNENIKTTLMSSSAYDMIVSWLKYSKYNVDKVVVSSSLKGNEAIGNFSASIAKTGASESYKTNNIYDLAGNVSEITTEQYNGAYVLRGAAYNLQASQRVMCIRYVVSNIQSVSIGFRPIMYIK